MVSVLEKYTKPAVLYRGSNPVEKFLDLILEEEEKIDSILENIIPMVISPAEELEFKKADKCHICGRVLGKERVRDHDHLTGHFR